jgi:hypothetical protein
VDHIYVRPKKSTSDLKVSGDARNENWLEGLKDTGDSSLQDHSASGGLGTGS